MLIVPAIDIMAGKVVRLRKGEFEKVSVYGASPTQFAEKWQSEGAEWIHVVDLDGARTGRLENFEIIESIIAAVKVPIEVGGGVRSVDGVRKYLEIGSRRVVLGTRVMEDPDFLKQPEPKDFLARVAVSIDIKQMQTAEIITGATSGWQATGDMLVDIPSLVGLISSLGIGFINFSDITRDGTLSGPDMGKVKLFLNLVRQNAKGKIFLTYAGGISSLEDIKALAALGTEGVDAVIVGKALYEDKFSLKDAIAAAG